MRWNVRSAAYLASFLLFASACGESGGDTQPGGDGGLPGPDASGGPDAGGIDADQPGEGDPANAIRMKSTSGCATDFDCDPGLICFARQCLFECSDDTHCGPGETCGERGRCLSGTGRQVAHASASPASVYALSDLAEPAWILPSMDEVEIGLFVEGGRSEGVAYWIERTDDDVLGEGGRRELGRLFPGENILRVPVGGASPASSEPRTVHLRIHTGAGLLRATMIPAMPASGLYFGSVTMQQLPAVPIELPFEVVTSPPGASLDRAERVWLHLFDAPKNLLFPFGHATLVPAGPQEVSPSLVREMQRRPDGAWSAIWSGTWRPAPGAGGLLAAERLGGTFGRSLRVDLVSADRDTIVGRVQDRWAGIDGTLDDAGFDGELVATRVMPTERTPFGPTEVGANTAWGVTTVAPSEFARCTADVMDHAIFDDACRSAWQSGAPTDAASIEAMAGCAERAYAALEGRASVGACLATFLGNDPGVSCPASTLDDLAVDCAVSLLGGTRADYLDPGQAPAAGDPHGLCAPAELALPACVAELAGAAAASASARGLVFPVPGALDAWVGATRMRIEPLELVAAARGASARFRWFDLAMGPPASSWSSAFDQARLATLAMFEQVAALRLEAMRAAFGEDASSVGAQLQLAGAESRDALVALVNGMLGTWQLALEDHELLARRMSVALAQPEARRNAWEGLANVEAELYVGAHLLRRAARFLGGDEAVVLRASVGQGYSQYQESVGLLAQPVEAMRDRRDGEIVRFTGLDAQDQGIVAQRLDRAQSLLNQLDGMQARLEQSRQNTINEVEIRQRDERNERELRETLALMCGVDLGRCRPGPEPEALRCEPLVGPERCGQPIFDGELSDEVQNVSEVARAIQGILRAALALDLAIEEHRAYSARVELEEERLRTFEDFTEEWLAMSVGSANAYMDSIRREQSLLSEAARLERPTGFWAEVSKWSGAIGQGISVATSIGGSIAKFADGLGDGAFERAGRAILEATRIDPLARWLGADGVASQVCVPGCASGLVCRNRTCVPSSTSANAGTAEGSGEDGGGGSNKSIDAFARGVVWGELPVLGVDQLPQVALAGLSHDQFDVLQRDAARTGYMRRRDISLDTHMALLAGVEPGGPKFLGAIAAGLSVVSKVSGIIAKRRNRGREKQAAENRRQAEELRMTRDYERMIRDAQIQNLQNQQQIADRQITLRQMLEDGGAYLIRITQAENEVERMIDEVAAMQERAELLAYQLDRFAMDREEREALRNTPQRYFDRIGLLHEVEERFESTRGALFDALVAVEYTAVRPFFTWRDRIVRATSVQELATILDSLRRLRQVCGGERSERTDTISLRRDVLGIRTPVVDPLTEGIVAPAEQLRSALTAAWFPRETLDALDPRTSRRIVEAQQAGTLLAVSFELRTEEFSGLFAVCNARNQSLSATLIGDVGVANPQITIIHDGQAALVSCHDERVMASWQNTQFGPTTLLSTRATESTANVTINEAPLPGSGNRSLRELPVAARYTLFIETAAGDNRNLDWSRLEDITLTWTYEYQNFFAASSECQ